MARRSRGDDSAASPGAPPLSEIADELYALPPNEFTPRRDAHASAARAAGDRSAATQITALRKPSTAAWLANQLVRAQPAQIEAFLQLGAGLREAQTKLQGDALRVLSQQRRQLINELVRQARRVAAEQGRPVTDAITRELEQTLEAAVSDPDAGAALAAGRLTTSLTPSGGFEAPTRHLRAVPAATPAGGRRPAAAPGESAVNRGQQARAAKAEADRAAREEAARAALDEAERHARDARQRHAAALAAHGEITHEIDQLDDEARRLREQIDELTSRLKTLHQRLADARGREKSTRREIAAAERRVGAADAAVGDAHADLDKP